MLRGNLAIGECIIRPCKGRPSIIITLCLMPVYNTAMRFKGYHILQLYRDMNNNNFIDMYVWGIITCFWYSDVYIFKQCPETEEYALKLSWVFWHERISLRKQKYSSAFHSPYDFIAYGIENQISTWSAYARTYFTVRSVISASILRFLWMNS